MANADPFIAVPMKVPPLREHLWLVLFLVGGSSLLRSLLYFLLPHLVFLVEQSFCEAGA
jgi:hypothetical protein